MRSHLVRVNTSLCPFFHLSTFLLFYAWHLQLEAEKCPRSEDDKAAYCGVPGPTLRCKHIRRSGDNMYKKGQPWLALFRCLFPKKSSVGYFWKWAELKKLLAGPSYSISCCICNRGEKMKLIGIFYIFCSFYMLCSYLFTCCVVTFLHVVFLAFLYVFLVFTRNQSIRYLVCSSY